VIYVLALDHIVYTSEEIGFPHEKFSLENQIKAVKGGEHEDWGTYNYLAHFSNDSYLEWLGVNDYDKAKQSDNPLIKHLIYVLDHKKEGPFQFALRTNQLDKYITHFKNNNIPFEGPFHGSREKPDGTELKWRMLFPKYNYEKEVLPFLIEWESENQISSLFNPQAITKINYGNMDIKRFRHIYHLKPRKLLKNRVILHNAKIFFTENDELDFELE